MKSIGKDKEVHFHQSVPMSTYITNFVLCDYAHKEKTVNPKGIGKPFPIRAYAPPDDIEKVHHALDVGVASLEFYIDYFQIEYSLPKMGKYAFSKSQKDFHWLLNVFQISLPLTILYLALWRIGV